MTTPNKDPLSYTVRCVRCRKEWQQALPPKGNIWCAFCWTEVEEERANRRRYGTPNKP